MISQMQIQIRYSELCGITKIVVHFAGLVIYNDIRFSF